MPDWSICKVEDISWDEFRERGDHIVPRPRGEHVDHGAALNDCHKKQLREGVNSAKKSSDSKSVAKDVIPEREEISFSTLNDGKGPKLENSLLYHTPGVGFADRCLGNSTKEMTGLGSDDAKASGNCFQMESLLSERDTNLGNNGASTNGSLCHFSIGDISPTNSDLELFGNDHEDKESNFLSYYGWPDIGNFEDVDRMFRSCDSTFGQGNATTADDEYSWFSSSSRSIDGSEDALKTGFKSSSSELSTLRHQEDDLKFMPISDPPVVIDIDKKNAPNNYLMGLQTMDHSDSASLGYFYGIMQDTNTESNRVSMLNEQVNMHGQQMNNQNQTEGKREDLYSEYINSGSFCDSGTTTSQQFANYMEMSSNPSVNATSITPEEKMWSRPQHKDLVDRAAFGYHLPVQKQQRKVKDAVGGHGDIETGIKLPTVEVDCSSVLEGSSMSSVLSDEISQEANSFRQLQYVMEQLDIRTKLCIRDSLYRLARSAEQRNNFVDPNNCIWDGRDKSGAPTTEEPNKSARFLDIESDTNPIDRSIAHLLFHRPSDSAEGALFTESRAMIQGSSDAVVPGKSICQEEISAKQFLDGSA